MEKFKRQRSLSIILFYNEIFNKNKDLQAFQSNKNTKHVRNCF